MTKQALIKILASEGKYDRIRIDDAGNITGHIVGQPIRYNLGRNTGGRVLIGFDITLLNDLLAEGRVTSSQVEAYRRKHG